MLSNSHYVLPSGKMAGVLIHNEWSGGSPWEVNTWGEFFLLPEINSEGDTHTYKRTGDEVKTGNAELGRIHIFFWKGKLSGIAIKTKGFQAPLLAPAACSGGIHKNTLVDRKNCPTNGEQL